MEKQHQSEEQLRRLNDNLLNTMLYQLRIEGNGRRQFTYVSEGVRALHGCSPEQAMADSACIYGSVGEEDRRRLHDEEAVAMAALATFETELRMQGPGGGVRWSQIVSRPRKLEDGAVLWDGIEIDITERKAAEQALAESEERYRRLFEVETDAILMVDRETGRFIDANPSALNLYGYTRQEFLSLKHTDVSAESEKTSHAIAGGQTFVARRMHRKKDGTTFPVEIHGSYFDSSGRKMHVAAIRDLTVQEQAEAKLRKSEAELNRAQAIAHVGSWSWDCQSNVVSWSAETYRIYGVTPETFDLSFSSMTRLVHPDDLPRLLKAHEAHGQGRVFEPLEYRVIRPNGDIRVLQIFSSEIERDAAGQPIRVFGALQDITELKLREQALRMREQQLRLYAEHSPVAVAMFDRDMKYLVVSRRWIEDYRLENQTLIGRSHYEVFPEIPQRWVEIHQRCLAGAVEKCDEDEFPRNGGWIDWIRWEIRTWHQADGSIGGIIIFSENITERKRAEEALRESESKLRGVFECSRDAIGIALKGKHVFCNPAYLKLFKADAQQMAGTSMLNHIAPSHRSQMAQKIERRATGENVPTFYETRGLRENGEEFDMEVSVSTYSLHADVFTIATIRDITERKRAEKALRDSEQRFGTIFQESPVALALSEFETGKFLEVNDALLRLMRASSKDKMLGRKSTEIGMISAADRAKLVHLVKTQGRVEQFVTEMRRLDGEAFTADLCIGSYEDKGQHLLLTSLVDITERRQVEESHAQLATVVEQASETIVITDTKGTILYANPAFEKSTGYTRAEALGQNPRLLKSKKHGDEFYRKMWESLDRGQVWHGHFINRHKNGTEYEEDATISPVRDGAGKIVNYVAVKRDVTREMQLERQFIQAQKMESVGQLAGGVAHDLNNMIAASLMYLELLQSNKDHTPETQEMIGQLIESAQRCANLTRQLLLFSRRSVMEVKLLDLNELLTSLLKMLGRLIGEHILVRFDRREGLPAIEADPGMIEQVIMNLAINARDAMPQGGKLAIEIEAIQADSERVMGKPDVKPGHFLCLSLSDTGCGMDDATRNRIFEPFFTTKAPGKGTGLGLATVHGIVAQHKGWVEVESEVDNGTTFKVFLPASTRRTTGATPEAPTAVKGGQETILVVEDEATLRRSVALILRKLGYGVFEVENGQTALNLWQQRRGEFDLLFTDMVMPEGLTGLDLAERLKKQKPNLKVIISSGYSGETASHSRLAASGITYLQKPYRAELLAKVIRDCLDRKS